MLNATQQNHSLWDAIFWWLASFFEQHSLSRKYAPAIVAQPAVETMNTGRKFPIPADKRDYYYTAAD